MSPRFVPVPGVFLDIAVRQLFKCAGVSPSHTFGLDIYTIIDLTHHLAGDLAGFLQANLARTADRVPPCPPVEGIDQLVALVPSRFDTQDEIALDGVPVELPLRLWPDRLDEPIIQATAARWAL